MSASSEIIDLTNSFTLVPHMDMSNTVIDLVDTDDSFRIETVTPNVPVPCPAVNKLKLTFKTGSGKAKIVIKQKLPHPYVPGKSNAASPISEKRFGGCPICWDDLGKNPLASTKCGHVYCLECIQKYLSAGNKTCPTCRKTLRGSTSYHPLYLSRN